MTHGELVMHLYPWSSPSKYMASPLHTRIPVQCCSLSWNLHNRELFLSSSWDDTIKLWSLEQPTALRTFTGHTYCVYQVTWCVTVCDAMGAWGMQHC